MSSRQVKLIVLPRAAQEITEQAAYYRERANVALAERWRAAVRNSIRSLRRFPESGNPFHTQTPSHIKRLSVEGFANYLIFYEFDAASNTIYIISVLHGARDLESLLN
ncbi:MAG TPA: type II toxin-antitoxin system RelE/ParE family toxin [Candidatus Aquilonibacter sp.]|nr:type II toxin-antitoxin system RelE/ParE family toxin [Candidatus Aquilonibacter sp.]